MSAKLLAALVAVVLAATPAFAQTPSPVTASDRATAARAKRQAETFEARARVLTLFDHAGKIVKTFGDRAYYFQPVISPDRTRVAVVKQDPGGPADVYVFDVATGDSTQITFSKDLEMAWAPAWSPDGSQLAYIALRDSFERVYRKALNGAAAEELLYQHPGSNLISTDWSKDGRFLTFSSTDLSGGALYALPLAGVGERKAIEVFRSQSQVRGGRFSPNGRFIAYTTDENGQFEVYVRPFDPESGAGATPPTGAWHLSGQRVLRGGPNRFAPDGGPFWRQDGKELYFVTPEQQTMAVEVSNISTFTFGALKPLFQAPDQGSAGLALVRISDDGQQYVCALHPAPTRPQITVFDRQGNVLSRLADGFGRNPALSPDGTKVAFLRGGTVQDIWTFDVASGKGTPVTNDAAADNFPIWSPDGTQVAYVSTRGKFSSIYRKAWDGTGKEEQLFQYTPGASIVLTDWSADGKLLTFHDGCAGVLHVVPISDTQNPLERKAIDWLRDEYSVAQARISPDARFMAYLSDETAPAPEMYEIYVRPFDASKPEAGAGSAKPVQVSTAGAMGMIFWRQDGKELYFITPEWEVMAVEVTTTPAFKMGTPKQLFKLPGRMEGEPLQWKNVSSDGQRFAFSINVPVNSGAR